MIAPEELQELVDFECKSKGGKVLSLYLNVDPTQHTKDEYRLALRNLLRDVAEEANPEDVARVERYFDFEYDWQGRGVAIFSCAQEGFWRAYSLAIPLENHAFVSHRPYLKPLTDILDLYDRYGVVVVDREGARIMLFNQGELVDSEGILGEEVKRLKHGGGSAAAGRRAGGAGRREEEVALRNLREAAELTTRFCEGGRCRRLILGGTGETVAQFQEMLPKELRDQVVASIQVDMNAPEQEILSRTLEVMEEVDRKEEEELVRQIVTAAAKGETGAIGLDDTLAAVQEGRARTLVVAEGYRAPGYQCANCGYATPQEIADCIFCGGKMEKIEDVVDAILHRAIDLGVEVEVVKGNQELEKAGYIGALLRY